MICYAVFLVCCFFYRLELSIFRPTNPRPSEKFAVCKTLQALVHWEITRKMKNEGYRRVKYFQPTILRLCQILLYSYPKNDVLSIEKFPKL
jgi:hypothetical protein